jgi:hypothetical protein
MKTTLVNLYGPAQTQLDVIARRAVRKGLVLLKLLAETWQEARELQRTAHRRYPFAEW